MDIIFNQAYAPAEAERGKFVIIDPTTITNLPSSSRGRYAILTYNVGADSSVTALSGGMPNTTQEQVFTLSATQVETVNFAPAASLVEISNKSTGSIYLTYTPSYSGAVASLSAIGIEIPRGYYSIERTTSQLTFGSIGGGNVVVFGHYKA